eukprot:jgi/Chlat1/2462/Chrsp171S02352
MKKRLIGRRKQGWEDDVTQLAVEGVLTAVKAIIERDASLISKKSLYVRLGCGGEWPNIEVPPPGA